MLHARRPLPFLWTSTPSTFMGHLTVGLNILNSTVNLSEPPRVRRSPVIVSQRSLEAADSNCIHRTSICLQRHEDHDMAKTQLWVGDPQHSTSTHSTSTHSTNPHSTSTRSTSTHSTSPHSTSTHSTSTRSTSPHSTSTRSTSTHSTSTHSTSTRSTSAMNISIDNDHNAGIYSFAFAGPSVSAFSLSFSTLLKILPLTLLGISSTNFTPPLSFL